MADDPRQVVVLGGGPAGATVARLLTVWGHDVLLLTRPPETRSLAISVPPSCRKLLAHLGVYEAVEAAGFHRTSGNTVWWGDVEPRTEHFADGERGFQVLRSGMERVLLGEARSAGVQIHGGTIRDVRRDGDGEWSVGVEDEGGSRVVRSSWVLDCTGRAGVVARRERCGGEAKTLAVTGIWTNDGGWALPDPSHTLVESFADGWGWSIPVSPTVRHVTLMVDPGVTDLRSGDRLDRLYRRELAKTPRLSDIVAGSEPAGRIWGCGASAYSSERFGWSGCLLVGDAASFIDPLSSYGVKKALASAWLAAVVVHTCLVRQGMSEVALELYASRERHVYDVYTRLAAEQYRDAGATYGGPFWDNRSTPADEIGVWAGGVADESMVRALRDDPGVWAAFEALKNSPGITLRRGEAAGLVREAAVNGREVVWEDRVRLSGYDRGIRYLRGVDLPALMALAPTCPQVPDLFDTYNERHTTVALPDFLGALSALLAYDVLRNVEAEGPV